MPAFDVPGAMKLFYQDLEKAGFHKPTINQLDSEWLNDTTGIEIRICHVARSCEIAWRDTRLHAKRDKSTGWNRLIRPYGDSRLEFTQWLAKCATVVSA